MSGLPVRIELELEQLSLAERLGEKVRGKESRPPDREQ
jgi:hypothetical protein